MIICRAAYVILFGGSLRAGDVLLTEGHELVEIVNDEKLDTSAPHVIAPLMVRFKEEKGERDFLLGFANKTGISDLRIRRSVEILSAVLVIEVKGKEVGPAFFDEEGYVLSQFFLKVLLQKVLTD